MPFDTSALSSQVLAQVMGILTLRTGSVAAATVGSKLAVERPGSGGAGTLLDAGEVREALHWDIPEKTTDTFLRSLSKGHLADCRYELAEERLLTPLGLFPFSFESLIRRQDAVDPQLKKPLQGANGHAVPLTIAGAFLENIARIPAVAFYEAAFRAMGCRQPEALDLVWMHAGEGELRLYDVTSPIVVGAHPPAGVSPATYREHPDRFPLVCFQYERSQWKAQARHVIGRPETRERLLGVLSEASWGGIVSSRKENVRAALVSLIRQSSPPPAPESEAPPAPVAKLPPPPPLPRVSKKQRPTPTRPPSLPRPKGVSEIFFRPGVEILRKGAPGIVAITEVEIAVEDISGVAKEYFDRAVRLCLGVRDPRNGDQVVLTAGEAFSKEGKVRDCVFVAPEIPLSRKSASYPKVGLEYRSGRWHVIKRSLRGNGHKELLRAVTTLAAWDIIPIPSEE